MEILERVRLRIPEESAADNMLNEYIATMTDRLCLRLGVTELPDAFRSICVDATVKMYRRTYYEGILSEGVAGLSTSFIEDILAEYESEISDWKEAQSASGSAAKVVTFL